MNKNNKGKQTVYFYSKDPKKNRKMSNNIKETIKNTAIILLLCLTYITRFFPFVFIALIISSSVVVNCIFVFIVLISSLILDLGLFSITNSFFIIFYLFYH